MEKCPQIHTIELLQNGITAKGIKYIRITESLRKFAISGKLIGDEGLQILFERLKDCPLLEELGIADCGLTSKGIGLIYPLKSVKRFGLPGNQISDESMISLSEALKEMPNLEMLHLYDCEITSQGAESLFDALKNLKFLSHIDIKTNKIEVLPHSIIEIFNNCSAVNIYIHGNPLVHPAIDLISKTAAHGTMLDREKTLSYWENVLMATENRGR